VEGVSTKKVFLSLIISLAASLLFASNAYSATADAEIKALLQTVGSSGCVFIRNGSEHSATEAENHLRLKYRNGKRYATSAEKFIEQLASKSSWTGSVYQIRCPGVGTVPSGQWLTERLQEQRLEADSDELSAPAATSNASSGPSR